MLRTAGNCVTSLSSTFLFSPSPVRTKLLIFHGLCTRFPRIVHAVAPFCASYGGRGTRVRRLWYKPYDGRGTIVWRPPYRQKKAGRGMPCRRAGGERSGERPASQARRLGRCRADGGPCFSGLPRRTVRKTRQSHVFSCSLI